MSPETERWCGLICYLGCSLECPEETVANTQEATSVASYNVYVGGPRVR